MGVRVSILGMPNTGKSFSRKFIFKGEEAFVIAPSSKITYLFTSEGKTESSNINVPPTGGKPASKLAVTVNGVTAEEFMKKNKISSFHEFIKGIVTMPHEFKIETSGNFVVCSEVKYINYYQKFVSKYMEHINKLFLSDFTHWISYILRSPSFRKRTGGGEAFARFWDMAADTLDNIILTADELRDDLIVYTEYHTKYNGEDDVYEIFVPAGNMLSDKFKPKSYYDIQLHTDLIPYEEEKDDANRYKFVVKNLGRKDGRGMNLFNDIEEKGMIPNNIDLVDRRIRKAFNI